MLSPLSGRVNINTRQCIGSSYKWEDWAFAWLFYLLPEHVWVNSVTFWHFSLFSIPNSHISFNNLAMVKLVPADLTPSLVCPHFPFNCCRMPMSFPILKNKPFLLSNWQPGAWISLGYKPIHFTVTQGSALATLMLVSGGTGTGQAGLLWLQELQESSKPKDSKQVIPHSGHCSKHRPDKPG